jgi:hypothetical protein
LPEGANPANVPGFARTPGPALKTGGTWETSQPELPAATTLSKKSGGAGAVIGVVLGLGVLGGAVFGAYALLGDRDGSVATAAQPASSPPPAEPAPPPPSPPEKPPEVTPEVTAEPVAPAPPEPSAAPAESAAPTAVRPSRPAAPHRPAPKVAPPKAPAPKTQKKPGQTPDFGY